MALVWLHMGTTEGSLKDAWTPSSPSSDLMVLGMAWALEFLKLSCAVKPEKHWTGEPQT